MTKSLPPGLIHDYDFPLKSLLISSPIHTELYRSIVEHVPSTDTSTLFRLLLVSKTFYAESIQRLYANFCIDYNSMPQFTHLPRHSAFIHRVIEDTSLAHLVHTFTLFSAAGTKST